MFAKHTRAVLLEVHTWTGLVVGFVLYAMLVFGAISLYREELGRWEDTAQHVVGPRGSDTAAIDALVRSLPPGVERYFVERPSTATPVHIAWHPVPGREEWRSVAIDAARGTVRESDVHASRLLFNMHFLWHEAAPPLYYVSGLVAVAFLLAVVTGTLFHLKQLGPQLGRFRPTTAPRVATTDLHKVLGVFGLPFQIVFAITGAFIVLGPTLVGTFTTPVFGGNTETGEHLVWGEAVPLAQPVPVAGGIDERIAFVERRYPGLEVESISASERGTPGETLELSGRDPGIFAADVDVEFEGAGMPMTAVQTVANSAGSTSITRWIFGLHYARFGGPLLRIFYVILALAAAATTLTGNLIWIARKGPLTHRYLRASTEATGTATFLATATLLLASRLLPRGTDSRHVLEEAVFFGTFLLVHLDSLLARDARAALVRHLLAIGAAFLALPIATWSIGSRGLLSFVAGHGSSGASVVGVDTVATVVGLVSLAIAAYVRAGARRDVPEPTTNAQEVLDA